MNIALSWRSRWCWYLLSSMNPWLPWIVSEDEDGLMAAEASIINGLPMMNHLLTAIGGSWPSLIAVNLHEPWSTRVHHGPASPMSRRTMASLVATPADRRVRGTDAQLGQWLGHAVLINHLTGVAHCSWIITSGGWLITITNTGNRQ